MVFEKTLTDLVKGIRASKRDTALYISSCIAEIKSEINSTDPHTKANALQKLTFLQMMGYNMSWASFATIEVMSSPRFAHKRIGYLAASQAFTQDTDVILLTTNTLKKELRGAVGPGMNGVYEAGLAINCLSNIVTEDLARELLGDITNLTVHPQPYLRKKAILCLLKIFMKYPHALRLAFPRIQDCLLKDSNSSVTSCAVNVVTELSEVNPKNYLVLAPSFFQLLTSSSNNWMLIKVVKLFGTLVPEEPRLARKLLEPLAEIVKNTQAKSLLYEAVHTITLCLPYCRKADGSMPSCVPDIVALCAETLKSFIEETDQNLKYLGLVGFGSLMISHPKVLSAPGYRLLILACLSDDDVTIRTRALDLLIGLATRKNIMDLVTQLLHHVDKASGGYKIDLVEKIVEMCSSDKYSLITDFAWYIDVLVILAKTKGIDGNGTNKRNLGPLISNQISDVTLRVLPVRPYSVRRMIGIMLDGGNSKSKKYFSGTFGLETNATMMPEVLPVAAFVVGEYSVLIDEAVAMKIDDEDDDDELFEYNHQSKGTYHAIIQALTDPSNIDMLALQTQSIYMQAALKVFAACTCSSKCSDEELEACVKHLSNILPVYMQSMDAEVQERAFTSFQLLKSLGIFPTFSPSMHMIAGALGENKIEKDDEKKTSDLLRLEMNVDTPQMTLHQLSNQVPTAGHTFNIPQVRSLSATLKYLLISEQMKPISSKAQRRKMASAPSNINGILEKENTTLFMNLLNSERHGKREVGYTNIDSVTFSQQLPLSEVSNKVSNKHTTHLLNPSIESTRNGDLDGAIIGATITSETKQQDPFYLESQLKVNDDSSKPSNRFDTIQLLDNESDDSRTAKKSKRKKKSKKKDAKPGLDIEFLSGLGSSASSIPNVRTKLPSVKQSLIDSDEDEDDEAPNLASLRAKEKASHLSSKHKLANIDLTTPIREDELIPEPRHRVAQERPPVTSNVEESTSRKKKKKKSKAATKDKVIDNHSQDLLDLGNLVSGGKVETTSSLFSSTQPSNAINNAFDDLLSLNMPAPLPAPTLPSTNLKAVDNIVGSVQKSASLCLWQRASLKCQLPSSSFKWENLYVFYKVDKLQNNNVHLSLKLRKDSTASIPNVIISFPGMNDLEINQLSSGNDTHIEKLGPLTFSSSTLKGSMRVAGEISKLRISIPYSTNMVPLQLHKDNISDLLGNREWASDSCKIDIPSAINEEELKASLQQFLSAAEVIDSSEKSTFMLASASKSGERAIFLIKRNTKSVKIDLKATDKIIVKSLVSDLKKITFL